MFKERTLFVLRAGARYHVNRGNDWHSAFPLGRELGEQIADLFRARQSNEHGNYELINHDFRQFLEMVDATLARLAVTLGAGIRSGLPFSPSIDHFLRDAEQAHTQLAKAAIAFLLLNCEKSHSRDLGAIDSSDLADITLDGIWQQVFCENLFTDCDRNNLAIANALERCRVISFNYDRTFEFIFHQSLRGRFSISDETIIKLLSKNLKIAYPYGCLGSLNSDDNKHFCKYGAPLRHDTDSKRRAMVATNGIRTFNEGAGPDKTFAEFVSWAERIVFLGFGFHGQNIRLLAPEQAAKPQIILGTTKGLRGAAIHDLKQSLKKAFRTEAVELHDLDCFHLLEEFRHLLVE